MQIWIFVISICTNLRHLLIMHWECHSFKFWMQAVIFFIMIFPIFRNMSILIPIPSRHNNSLRWRHNGRDSVSITSLTIVYSTVYLDADQRKHQSFAPLAFVWGIHRDRWIPRTKGQLRGKCFHLMTSSCYKHMCRWFWQNVSMMSQHFARVFSGLLDGIQSISLLFNHWRILNYVLVHWTHVRNSNHSVSCDTLIRNLLIGTKWLR